MPLKLLAFHKHSVTKKYKDAFEPKEETRKSLLSPPTSVSSVEILETSLRQDLQPWCFQNLAGQ